MSKSCHGRFKSSAHKESALVDARDIAPSRSYIVQSSIFKCFNRRKERSLVTKMASAANA